MAYPMQDDSQRTRAGTYANFADDTIRQKSSTLRHTSTADHQPVTQSRRPTTGQTKTTRVVQRPPVDDVINDIDDDDYYITVQVEDDVINQDYYQQRRNRRHHTDTDPELNIPTSPSQYRRREDARTVRVDVSKRGKKPLTFYFKVIGGTIVAGAIAWYALIAPMVNHYHTGDHPTHQYTVIMGGEKCTAMATMNGNVIDIMIAPQSFASKVHPEVQVAQYKGSEGTHDVTLQTNLDVNGDGRTDIIVSVDGQPVATLLADSNGYHWSNQK